MKIVIKLFLYLIVFLITLFLLFYLLTWGDYKVAETVEQDPSIPHIELEGSIFHAETFGNDSNEVIIFLHGGPGNDYRYLLDMKELSDEYFLVFYDQRGTGLSPRVSAEELSLESSIVDLNRIINYYSPDKQVILVGHSWGGMVASGYIGAHPGKVKKAVMAEPGMLTSETGNMFLERTNGMRPKLSASLIWKLGKILFQSLHISGPDGQARGDYVFVNIAMINDPDNPMAGYFCNGDMSNTKFPYWRMGFTSSMTISKDNMNEEGILQINLTDGVDQFTGKALFLTGECNIIIGEDIQRMHMAYFKNARMEVIQNAGHNMLTEQPEICIKLIREFLNEDE